MRLLSLIFGHVGRTSREVSHLRGEVAALRDARINDVTAAQVDRDVVQVRLTWEKARFE